MKRLTCCLAWMFLLIGAVAAQDKEVKLKIVQTSDIHGNFYPHDFILQREAAGSLARVHAFVQKARETYKDNLILLDNGDILQGQPTAYYYNYIDTVSLHVTADMLNFMGYDAANMGNHDVETGRAVFDRWAGDCRAPVLGANIIDTATGEPHFRPYKVLERDGVKIAVLGMITPAIPVWLSENLWRGLRFDDMEETARKWMKIIREKERPDIVIGMFHAGQDALLMGGKYRENASLDVARNVPGFDIVLMGHDHARECKKVQNVAGDSVLVMDPASNGIVVSDIDITVTLRNGKVTDKQIDGVLTETAPYGISGEFMKRFSPQYATIQDFVSKRIGRFTKTVSTRPAYFGSSAFIDLIHTLQLDISGAEISLAAPLSYDTQIKEGDIYVYDMFNLYKYENMLYTMKLSGKEVHDALEMSYDLWTNRMTSPDDHILLLRDQPREGAADRAAFKNFSFNFDSAAGIIYTVDVTKPCGSKVTILSMADGTPFHMDKMYTVALNSYRGNGGGELLTKGAGISQDELKDDALEMSYDLWTNRMTSPDDHILLLRDQPREGAADRAAFKNFSFNFDSAAGIIYTVDVTKPCGSKVTILSMADGTPFHMDKMYTVALNSYRGNGGGELLTKGAGISQDELKERIISSTDKDLRYYLMQYIEQKKVIEPRALGQWKFIPEEWAVPASKRDYEFLFGTNRN